jgi:hypothetical protein
MAVWLAVGGIAPVLGESAPAPVQAAPAQASPANNLVGTVTAMEADSLTVKLESGSEARISITPQTRLLRTAPGEKTLKGATPTHLEDLSTGDRVLVLRAAPGAEPGHYSAAAIVTMKQADIAQARATQARDWQRRGVDGIVKSVEPAPAGGTMATIVIGAAQPGHTLTIDVTPTTEIRRYADDSVNFADAKPAALADIHPGDQLRARGDRNADGTEVTAVEIVSGSFRNVAGTITAIDPAQNTLTVTDLATKKPVTMRLTAQTQMRKLPPEMAQRLAARSGQAGGQAAGGPGAARPFGAGQPPPAMAHASDTPGANPSPAGEPGGAPMRSRGDAAGMLQHAPPVTLAELKKGDAIMVVAARGGGEASNAATAITLIAGVEALLESSAGSASQNLFSASWNLSGSGAAEGAAP